MNAFLNILKYLLVVVLVAIAALIIACGCLVLFPNASIFGLSYVSYYDSSPKLTQYQIDEEPYKNCTAIAVDAGIFNVDISIVDTKKITNGSTHLNVLLERHLSGFAIGSEDEKVVKLIGQQISDGTKNILSLKINQPQRSMLFSTDASLQLLVTADLLAEKEIVIKTTSGAVSIGKAPVYDKDNNNTTPFVAVKSLKVETDKGAVTLGCANYIDPITITQNKGDIKALVDLNVSATLSQKEGVGNINLKKVGSETNPQNLVIDGMFNSTLNVPCVYGDFLGKDIKGGNIKIGTIKKDAVINNDYADVNIEHMMGDLVYTSKEGALNIKQADAKLNIQNKNGAIYIENAGNNASDITHTITTEKASVKIDNLHNNIDVTTTKGAVDIVGVPTDTTPVTVNIVSNDGAIKLDKVNGNVTYKCENGNSSITVDYAKLVGGSTYLNQSGAITIATPYETNTPMWLRWETKKTAKINLISYSSELKESAADHDNVVFDGGKEKGISINGATTATAEYIQIATRMGVIKVNRKSA